MFSLGAKKRLYIVHSPGSRLFDEARFVLKKEADLPEDSEKLLSCEAERIIAEYGLLPTRQKDFEAKLAAERKRDRRCFGWFFGGIFTSVSLFFLAAGILRILH